MVSIDHNHHINSIRFLETFGMTKFRSISEEMIGKSKTSEDRWLLCRMGDQAVPTIVGNFIRQMDIDWHWNYKRVSVSHEIQMFVCLHRDVKTMLWSHKAQFYCLLSTIKLSDITALLGIFSETDTKKGRLGPPQAPRQTQFL